MSNLHPIAESLDALSAWRAALGVQVMQFGRTLIDHELLDEADGALLSALHDRLTSDKLVLAFVAEFSRGKSELINAIFFADAGRRVLPATPGRTTMCPVELRFEAGCSPRLSLLPIDSRLQAQTLSELRQREELWEQLPLDPKNRDSLAQSLLAVTRTRQVSVAQAEALGLWSTSQPDDNPPQAADGRVEIPAWRHAVINYPHPLLARGLVVIDTPGLNAVGAEPELTLGLLPSAHAVVFVLAADTGVTRSDLAIWREHLSQASQERFVVLNKIDALMDPLAARAEVDEQINQQCDTAADTLGVPMTRVFPLSAREALAARVAGDAVALQASRLPVLEQALTEGLLPRRQALLLQSAVGVTELLQASSGRRLADRRRQHAEQLMELRGLRGKSGGKLRLLVARLDAESADFEQCVSRLVALRAVQTRIQRTLLGELSSDLLRVEVGAMQAALGVWPFKQGGRAAFDTLMSRLASAVRAAATQASEMQQMLEASFRQLNTEFGFAFALTPLPTLQSTFDELQAIDRNYSRYLGLAQAWRLAQPGFVEQFRRMLLSKLRVVFETAASELEVWSRAATNQVEAQLRERRGSFVRRREALLRVQAASGELEQRINEVQAQDSQLEQVQSRLTQQAAELLATASRTGAPALQHAAHPISAVRSARPAQEASTAARQDAA
jgi:hypothetical protein